MKTKEEIEAKIEHLASIRNKTQEMYDEALRKQIDPEKCRELKRQINCVNSNIVNLIWVLGIKIEL